MLESQMSEPNTELEIKLLLPGALSRFELPSAVARRLEWLLDKQDR